MPSIFVEKLLIKGFDFVKDIIPSRDTNASGLLQVGTAQALYNRDKAEELYLCEEERNSHLYVIGATGAGKSTFIENCLRQDILSNRPLTLIDPHGDLAGKVVNFIASIFKEKSPTQKVVIAKKLILIEPNMEAIVGFNPLEVRGNDSVYQTVLQLMSAFRTRYAEFFGPRMEEILRMLLFTLCENGLTLVEAPAVLTNLRFRKSLVEKLSNAEVSDYWKYRYDKLSDKQKQFFITPVLDKVTEFLTDPYIKCVIGQTKCGFDFNEALNDNWTIINLSKGKLKENAFLLGSLYLSTLQMAAMARVTTPYHQRIPCYIYIDEFQNFVGKQVADVETILSEARKYKMFLRMAHQTISQIERKLIGAILGNSKAILSFRLSHNDAAIIGPELNAGGKEFLSKKLTDFETGQAVFKVVGKPCRQVQTPLPEEVKIEQGVIEELKNLSYSFYAKSAREIEEEIVERHEKLKLVKDKTQNNSRSSEGQNDW